MFDWLITVIVKKHCNEVYTLCTGKLFYLCWIHKYFVAWYHHTSLTNFIIQQSQSFEGISILLCLTNCLFLYPTKPTVTELFQSLLYGFGTVFRSILYLLCHFLFSALAWRHTFHWTLLSVNYCCCARKVRLTSGHVNRSYLRTTAYSKA